MGVQDQGPITPPITMPALYLIQTNTTLKPCTTNGKMNSNSSMEKTLAIDEVIRLITASLPPSNMRTKVIAIDGCGGAGKSTFANELSKHLGNCAVIHTDDFASWDNSVSWYPRMIEQVLAPLRENKKATYQRYDWKERKLANWIDVDPQPFVIVEGVSSSRKEFREFLSFSFFIRTNRELRLQRGLERDGVEAKEQWLKWMQEEDDYIQRDQPESYVDLIISGESTSLKVFN